MSKLNASELIDMAGGTTAVAKLFDIKPPSVHEWRDRGIPTDKLIRLAPLLEAKKGSPYTRKTLFPNDWQDIWPELAPKPRKASKAEASHG